MNLTKKQIDQFEEAAKPLISWIGQNCHPHVHVVVDNQDAALFEGIIASRKDFAEKKGH